MAGRRGTFVPAPEGSAGLIQATDGNIYGTTALGGTDNFGTIFMVTPDGTETVLYAFKSGATRLTVGPDGAEPAAGVTEGSDGNFYGTAAAGGANGGGTLFRLTPTGAFTVLYSFGHFDGPDTTLVQGSDGNLYGATYGGGANNLGYFFRFPLN
jgi:uncharacterized repeat protein (TIGR03803 family)